MTAAEIRQRFLDFFRERGHEVRPSSSLVPADDPTLLFTNAGMVQFKRVFLGLESLPFARAVTSQKCVRAGGKHNDLEEVGRTTRHHTFFEMLGNFSFGDYFKRDAVRFAWDFLTEELALDPSRLFVTVHEGDDEAARLWQEEVGLDESRIFRLGDADNFWQMADTGPCGPCSELHYDVRSDEARSGTLSTAEFERLGHEGSIVELWNLVFMQFDRDESGEMHPLPAPSIDTGAGLERLAMVLQGVDSNFHTDLFSPLIERVAEAVGRPYDPSSPESLGYRVLADHGRAVAFLLADGVFPSSEGRGYVLRRILRRAVRHAWLLGRREPTLVHVVDGVVEGMGEVFPDLVQRREHLLQATRAEEQRFLGTIEGGLQRFDEIAPAELPEEGADPMVSGEDAFRLYDTFGFPIDLTELMAEERGYRVDRDGFEAELNAQRERSRADRAEGGHDLSASEDLDGWTVLASDVDQAFVGYETRSSETEVLAYRVGEGRIGVVLRENPFYVEAGGQVSDRGRIEGEGLMFEVDDVRRIGDRVAVYGALEGDSFSGSGGPIPVRASVFEDARHDTERNHTATHLLHAALRAVLGDHVVQRGSLVEPQRLRFDFSHTAPMTLEERREVEEIVNRRIWEDHPVDTSYQSYEDAVGRGAMALFGEKYGDEVRVVDIPGVSTELCGGTHVRHTSEIGLLRISGESGVASGVRRIEAETGGAAFDRLKEMEARVEELAEVLRSGADNVVARAAQLVEERNQLERMLSELRRGGSGGGEDIVSDTALELPTGGDFRLKVVRLKARDADDARVWGDGFLEAAISSVAVLGADLPDEKQSLFAFVTDDLVSRGIRADALVREVAAVADGRGGGRPHMAQAGVGDPAKLGDALAATPEIVARMAAQLTS